MKKVNGRHVLAIVFVAVFSRLMVVEPASVKAMDDMVFETPEEANFDSADAAFDVKPASAQATGSAYASADAAFAEAPISAPVNTEPEANNDSSFGAFSQTNMGSIPASVAASA